MAEDIAEGIGELVGLIRWYPYGEEYPTPEVLLVSPIEIGAGIVNSKFTGFRQEAHTLSQRLPELYRKKAKELGCGFFDASSVAAPSRRDELHMEADSHRALSEALAKKVLDQLA